MGIFGDDKLQDQRIAALEGNPGKRRLNRREPKPKSEAPRCPVWLSEEAKKVWRRTVPDLKRMRVLSVVDGDALAAYCQIYARWKGVEEFLAKHGEVYSLRDENGRIKYMQPFPHVSIAKSLLHLLKSFQQEFGLTPSSRSRIEVQDPDTLDEEERLARRLLGPA